MAESNSWLLPAVGVRTGVTEWCGKVLFLRVIGHLALGIAFGTSVFSCCVWLSANSASGHRPRRSQRLAEVAGAGMVGGHTFQYMEQLSDDIGARVTGSPDAARAIDWGLKTMRSIGLEDVHSEPWQLWRGWTRGVAEVWLISPNHRKLTADSMGWVGSTAVGGVDADVVQVNLDTLADEISKNSSDWTGKVLLVRQRSDHPTHRLGPAEYGRFLSAANAAQAVAAIGGQGGKKSAGIKLTHTGILGFRTYYEIPVLSMAAEDQAQIERLLDEGKPVKLHINVQNTTTSGPVPSAIVVGEIRGTEHPEEVFVVGGHLDSWDLAQGATDNGCGVATVLGAAEAIFRSGLRPRRTIRFVLFTGEEQGLVGSREYVKLHQADMHNYLGDIVLDEGQGPVVGFDLNGRSDLTETFKQFVDTLGGFGQLGVITDPVFGTDTGSFTLAGLPGILLTQDTSEYQISHHSAADTVDKVDRAVLTRNATIEALVAFWIADQPSRFAEPWPAERAEKMLRDAHMEEQLRVFGMWPFAN